MADDTPIERARASVERIRAGFTKYEPAVPMDDDDLAALVMIDVAFAAVDALDRIATLFESVLCVGDYGDVALAVTTNG